MYLIIYENNFLVKPLVSVNDVITKGIAYEVLYITQDEEGEEHYELIGDDNQYHSLNSKYFYKI